MDDKKDSSDIIAYQSDDFAKKSLRTSQRAVLKVAEKSISEGEYDTGVDLYSKLLTLPNIKRTTKIKIEKNINNVMHRIQRTVRVAKQFIPPEVDVNQMPVSDDKDLNVPEVDPSRGSGIGDPGTGFPGQGGGLGSGSPGEGEGMGVGDPGGGGGYGSGMPPPGVIETITEVIETIQAPGAPPQGEYPGQPGSGQGEGGINLQDVDIQGVKLKNIDLENLGQPSDSKVVTENLLSDAIDYTIDRLTDNIGQMVASRGGSGEVIEKADFRSEKLHESEDAFDFVSSVHENEVQLTEQFFKYIEDLKNEIGSLNDNIEDLKPAFIGKISDTIFPDPSAKKASPKDESDSQETLNESIQELSSILKQASPDEEKAIEKVIGKEDDVSNAELSENIKELSSLLKSASDEEKKLLEEKGQEDLDIGSKEEIAEALFKEDGEEGDSKQASEDDFPLNEDFFKSINQIQSDVEDVKEDVNLLKTHTISDISDTFFPETGSKSLFKDDAVQDEITQKLDEALSMDPEEDIKLDEDFFKSVNQLQSELEGVKEAVDDLKSHSINDISDTIFPKPSDSSIDPAQFQDNMRAASEFFDKVNTFADNIQSGIDEHNVDQAFALLEEKPTDSDSVQPISSNLKEDLGELSDTVNNAVMDHQMSEMVESELGTEMQDLKEGTLGIQEGVKGLLDGMQNLQENAPTQEQLDILTRRTESFEKEMDTFEKLVEMLNSERERREESEKTLSEFSQALEGIKQQLTSQDGYPESEPLEIFQAAEEILNKRIKRTVPKDRMDDMQSHENLDEILEDDEFRTLEEVIDEDLSHVRAITKDDALREDAKENFHDDIDPSFIPTPYSTDYDYKNEDGFFQDISGTPVAISSPIELSQESLQKSFDEQMKKLSEPTEKPDAMDPSMAQPPPFNAQPFMPQPQSPFAPPRKPRRSLREPIRLTYDFRNLFHNKYYRKYRDMLNEAATLVAEKKLDEALEYYYVIRDQNIPQSFRLMIQQNINDIEETIADTFRYSDTIVKVDEAGEISRVRVVEQEELESEEIEYIHGSNRSVVSREVAFHED